MVSDDIALEKITLNSDGVIANARPNSTYIDMSTVSPGLSAKISAAAVNKNINYLRAPVNGTVMQAETSTLVILVSGPEEEFEKQKDIFETIYYASLYTSHQLATVDGPYETFFGSPISKGRFHKLKLINHIQYF